MTKRKTAHAGGAGLRRETSAISRNAVPADDWVGRAISEDTGITDFVVDHVRAYRY